MSWKSAAVQSGAARLRYPGLSSLPLFQSGDRRLEERQELGRIAGEVQRLAAIRAARNDREPRLRDAPGAAQQLDYGGVRLAVLGDGGDHDAERAAAVGLPGKTDDP